MATCSTNVCGTGTGNWPQPGDPDNNSILTATPAFGGIDVSWTYPTVNPFAVSHVILYRGILPNFNSAIVIATVGGNFFYDKSTVNAQLTYYYWIRIVSVNGTIGDLIGPASAIARPTIDNMIELLTSKIDSGLLAQSLKTEIDKITLNYQDLLDEVDDRIASNTALSTALAQVQTGVTQALTFLNEEITDRQDGDSALVTQLNTVAAANQSNLALIQQEQSARVTGDEANASLYTLLNAQVNNATTGLPATRATLLNDYFTKAGTNSAISSATSTLVSTTALNTALSNYTNTASLQTNYYTKTATDSAISSATSTLVSTTTLNNSLANYTNTAALQSNYYTKTGTDGAISSAITTSQATLNNNIASAQTTLQTNINTVDGKVTQIGALYTAKVTVNGLIGGFGIYNDGTTVEAGFDVDTFWVGRTAANKKKPFIISNNEVFIDQAVINTLTFTKLRDEAGAVVIENGKIKANYLQVNEIFGGSYSGYAWPTSGNGFYLGPSGLLLGNFNTGKYLQVTAAGDIYNSNFDIVNGAMTAKSFATVGGRFSVLNDGTVTADRVRIQRRDSAASGSGYLGVVLNTTSTTSYTSGDNTYYTTAYSQDTGHNFWIDTGIDDANFANFSINQYYGALLKIDTSYVTWFGGGSPTELFSTYISCEIRQKSTHFTVGSAGNNSPTNRIWLWCTVSIRNVTTAVSVNSIRLDNYAWSLFKL